MQEKRLYKGCRTGDPSVQREVFNEYFPLFVGLCRRYTLQTDEAKDFAQEGMIKIFSKIDSFQWNGKGSFVAWMKRIVVNTAISNYHKNKIKIDNEVDVFDAEHTVEETEDSMLCSDLMVQLELGGYELMGILEELPENFRIVFNLYVIDGFKHREIAEMLDIPEKTSTTRLMRARKMLKRILEERIAGANLIVPTQKNVSA